MELLLFLPMIIIHKQVDLYIIQMEVTLKDIKFYGRLLGYNNQMDHINMKAELQHGNGIQNIPIALFI